MSHRSLHSAFALYGLAAAAGVMGLNSPYYNFDLWSESRYISLGRCRKSRNKQWAGHSKKILAIRRKHNKAAKQARKLQWR